MSSVASALNCSLPKMAEHLGLRLCEAAEQRKFGWMHLAAMFKTKKEIFEGEFSILNESIVLLYSSERQKSIAFDFAMFGINRSGEGRS